MIKTICFALFFVFANYSNAQQFYNEYVNEETHLHLSLSNQWIENNIDRVPFGTYNGQQIFGARYILVNDSNMSFNENAILTVTRFRYVNYYKDNPSESEFYKSFTFKNNDSAFHSINYSDCYTYRVINRVDKRRKSVGEFEGNKKSKYKVLEAKFIKNNEVFVFRFRCPANKFKASKHLFLDVLKTVYFDNQ